ncbi:MAG: WYL domain-containing protein [Myxococcaceae bacterium]|nr:WYL domain-containing protein [Myxococcaceae bacterium]
MDRTERLLDLVALFLDADAPVSWADIRGAFPEDYGVGPSEANERKFERDKAELLELGLPLSFVPPGDDLPSGYVVDREAYALPEAGLKPDELAVLYAAGSAALASGAFPGAQDLAHALRQRGFLAGPNQPDPRVRLELGGLAQGHELPQRLEQLWAAVSTRKKVELEYHSPHTRQTTRRTVDPYGLALRRGVWNLVGHCHLRQGIRTFHVHRVRALSVNAAKPKSPDFEVPAAFRLDDYVATWPWQHRFHPPVEVTLTLSGALAPLADSLFPKGCAQGTGPTRALTVPATDLDALLAYVLSLGPQAKVTGPDDALQRLRAMATKVHQAHQGAARG